MYLASASSKETQNLLKNSRNVKAVSLQGKKKSSLLFLLTNTRPLVLSLNWNIKGSWWRGPKFYSQFSYFLWWIFSLSLLLANGMSLGFLCCSPPTRLLMVLFLVVREIIHHSSVQKWEGFTRKPYRVASTSSLDTHKVPAYYRHWAKNDLLFSNGFTWQKLDCSMNYILWWKVARTIFLIILFQCLLMCHILLPRLCTYIICDVLFSEAKVKWPVLSHL